MAQESTYKVSQKQAESIVKYLQSVLSNFGAASVRQQLINTMESADRDYIREWNNGLEHARAKAANERGDKSRIQDITVPIVLPQVEAAVTYLHSVFLSGNPIFGVVADPRNIDAAMQYETLMIEHSQRGGWIRQFNLFFRDGLKYPTAALEVSWDEETVYRVENTENANGKSKLTDILWAGNKIRRLDPYNVFFDTRVPPAEVHQHGEFAGYVQLMSRVRMKQFVQDLRDSKIISAIKPMFEEGHSCDYYYTPQLRMDKTVADYAGFDWLAWAGDLPSRKIEYKNLYEVTTIYARILPADFGLEVPGKNNPQIWKFVIVGGKHLLVAERMTNAHNYLPIIISQFLEDGLNFASKTFAENVSPMQNVASSILNASLHSRRRAVYDRLAYDPSRVREEDINKANPVQRIPMRPAAYGRPVGEAFYQFPFNEAPNSQAFQELQMVSNFAEMVSGVNRAQQGMFVKGNKTRHEYADVMQHSNARLQTIAAFLEAQVMVPVKEILKFNILQYAPYGQIYNPEIKKLVEINPMQLREAAIAYKISDGFTPADKLLDADTFQVILQTYSAVPQMQQIFNIAEFIRYYLKSQGARYFDDFLLPPQQQQGAQQQQQGAQQNAQT